MGPRKFKLTLAYDGTAYHGWQSQKSGRGVQDRLEAALARLFGADLPRGESSSRTDTGVHAFGMVVHFEVPGERFRMPENHLALALNACLPPDIRVHEAVAAPPGFHARFDATGKQYRYHVWNHPAMNPLLRHQTWHVPESLDLARMRDAACQLTGHHDFRAFTSNRGHPLEDSHRLLSRCEIRRRGPHLTIILEADGFLYKMCRGIVGTLVGIGRGDSQVADVGSLLENPDRRLAGMNAPAHGLVLWKVSYGEKDGRARLAGP